MTGTHVFHRSLSQTPPVAVGGEGVYLIDSAGRRYVDASGGAAVSCLGHGHPDVIAAMHAQIDRLANHLTAPEQSTPPLDHLAGPAILAHDVREDLPDFLPIRIPLRQHALGRLRVAQDDPERLIEFMRQRAGDDPQRAHPRQVRQLLPLA